MSSIEWMEPESEEQRERWALARQDQAEELRMQAACLRVQARRLEIDAEEYDRQARRLAVG